MEEDRANPNCQPSSPLPTWLEDQAFSGQWMGAGGSSALPLLEAEEERDFVNMDEECECNLDQELTQWAGVSGREPCLYEEMTAREFDQWQEEMNVQEVSPWLPRRHQEMHQWEVGVRAQCGHDTQLELELYHWEEAMTVQELDQWDKDDGIYQELSQGDGDVTSQELSWGEGEVDEELSPLEDKLVHPHICQWEEEERDPELSQVGDSSPTELSQRREYDVMPPQWEKDMSDHKLSQREERGSRQGLSQGAEGVSYKTWDKALHPKNDKDAQTSVQEGPSSPSSVAGEAARELPSTSRALASPTEAEQAATAAPATAAEVEEEPSKPLTPEVEKAPSSPAFIEEVPVTGTDSQVPAPHSPPGYSQALPDSAQSISSEMVSKDVLETPSQQPEEQIDPEQSMAAQLEEAAPVGREESPISAPKSPCSPPSPSPSPLGAQAPSEQQEEADRKVLLPEEDGKEDALAGEPELSPSKEEKDPELSQGEMSKYQEVSKGDGYTESELTQGDAGSYQQVSKGEAVPEPEQSPGDAGSFQEVSKGEARSESVLSQGHGRSFQEPSKQDECIKQDLSQGATDSRQEFADWKEPVEQGLSQGEVCSYHELSDWDECNKEDLSLGEAMSYEDVSDWEENMQQGLSQGEVCSYCGLISDWDECCEEDQCLGEAMSYEDVSDWEECMQQGLSQGKVCSCCELSDWNDYSEQELPHGEVRSYQEPSDWEEYIDQKVQKGNCNQPFMQSSWEDDSDSWDSCEHVSLGVNFLLREEDKLDDVSVLELCEDREQRPGTLTGSGPPVPIPREAWVECQAFELCHHVLCASHPHPEAQAFRGHTVCPAFAEHVREAWTQSPLPVLHCCSSPSAHQLGALTLSQQLGPPQRRPSRIRSALQAVGSLFYCSCLAARPED